MPVSLVILTQPGDARPRRVLTVAAGTSILTAAHDGGVDVTATCGGRGRCTSCRVKFIEGTIPPPTIMDEIQLGDDLVREGYRLSCQCTVTEPITVQVAPPLDEQAFQILGAGPGVGGLGVRIDAGIAKELVKVSLPREEHHQTSDLEQLAAAIGVAPESVGPSVLAGLPQALRVAVDIATNGEVLLGSRERLLACSAPAGPALEGAQIRHGMRGAQGAIDKVTIDHDVHIHTIGETPALGICGSGLIDLLAGLLDAGVIDWTGLIQVEARDSLPPALRGRVAMRGEERVFVVLRPGEAGAHAEIVLTQDDVRQVQLAKGAIASGIAMLLHVAAVPLERVEELLLAGGFGNYLSIASAIRIGLIPALPLSRVRYVGNAASLGAQLCLLSEDERARADAIASRIEHVSLAAHPDFEQILVDAMNFPRD